MREITIISHINLENILLGWEISMYPHNLKYLDSGSKLNQMLFQAHYSAYNKLSHTIQMPNDRQIHRLNYQWQAIIVLIDQW